MTMEAYLIYCAGLAAAQLGISLALLNDWDFNILGMFDTTSNFTRTVSGCPKYERPLTPSQQLDKNAIANNQFNDAIQERIIREEMDFKLSDLSRIDKDMKVMIDNMIINRYSVAEKDFDPKESTGNGIEYKSITNQNSRAILVDIYNRFNNISNILTKHRLEQYKANSSSKFSAVNYDKLNIDEIKNLISRPRLKSNPLIVDTEESITAESKAFHKNIMSTAIKIFEKQMDQWNNDPIGFKNQNQNERKQLRNKVYFPEIKNIISKQAENHKYNEDNIDAILNSIGNNPSKSIEHYFEL